MERRAEYRKWMFAKKFQNKNPKSQEIIAKNLNPKMFYHWLN